MFEIFKHYNMPLRSIFVCVISKKAREKIDVYVESLFSFKIYKKLIERLGLGTCGHKILYKNMSSYTN